MGRLTGERKALAATVLALFGLLYLGLGLVLPPEMEAWKACILALAAVYGLAFWGLVAGYFWSRWYAIGVGISGLVSAAFSAWQIGPEPVLMIYGASHAAISLLLWGKGMAAAFDGQLAWRQRFHLDEAATNKLGKSVIRLGISLPYVVMYGLAPRDGAGSMLLALAGVALAGLGTWALFTMRTWALVALAGAAGTFAVAALGTPTVATLSSGYGVALGALGLAGAGLLVATVAPFAGPVVRHLRPRA